MATCFDFNIIVSTKLFA